MCPAGSASGGKASACTLCPPGFYQDLPGQSTCKQCRTNTDLFTGYGANDYALEGNTVVCALRSGNVRASSRRTMVLLSSPTPSRPPAAAHASRFYYYSITAI
jgi:hypothetical protein